MRVKNVLEQHIAVFGASGSGKTVLLSSFYGATQDPDGGEPDLFHVVADDTGQGNRLLSNYLGMRDSARVPPLTRFRSIPYAFTVKLKNRNSGRAAARSFDALRLVWHDYPGEWFQEEVSGSEVAQRRVDAFRSLLGSDVAFLLVDGAELAEHAGEEERYLKLLLHNYRSGLLRLEDELLGGGGPLVRFPRIWILALSKADLLPELDVIKFRDLVISKAADDLNELRAVLQGLVDSPDALSVGEDYVLFSSAKFEPGRIEVAERIGLDLILPLAAMLPFERHLRWVDHKQAGAKVAEELLEGVGPMATAMLSKVKWAGPKGVVANLIAGRAATTAIAAASKLGGDELRRLNADAVARKDGMTAVLTRFGLDLDDGERRRVLLRSKR